jgi:vacuolar-type H+-ATPase subunit H
MTLSIGEGDSNITKGGPVTQEGKEVVKWNAVQHGIRSPAPVVPGVEKKEDWEAHRDGVLESLQPEGHLELVLAERVALLSWRLNRVTRYETETITLSQEKLEDDLADRRRFSSYVVGPSHPEDVRGALQDALRAQRLIKRFPKLPDDKGLSGPDAASILDLVWGLVDEDVEPEEVQMPEAIPEWASLEEYMAEWDGWTVSLVRECISAIASAAKEDQQELIEAATERARLDIMSAKAAAERVEQDLARMSRERLLPDEKTLEKVSRYEAHLSRLFHKTLHELEALQTRRSGGVAPLARLDVDGLVGS